MAFEVPKKDGKLYVVTNNDDMTIVRAAGPAVALRHVIGNTHQVRPATPDDVEWYLSVGGVVEHPGKKDDADTTDGSDSSEEGAPVANDNGPTT